MFGGIGLQEKYSVVKNVDVFAGLGYVYGSFGYNVGSKFKFITSTKAQPFCYCNVRI
jgi:hypothetical protein